MKTQEFLLSFVLILFFSNSCINDSGLLKSNSQLLNEDQKTYLSEYLDSYEILEIKTESLFEEIKESSIKGKFELTLDLGLSKPLQFSVERKAVFADNFKLQSNQLKNFNVINDDIQTFVGNIIGQPNSKVLIIISNLIMKIQVFDGDNDYKIVPLSDFVKITESNLNHYVYFSSQNLKNISSTSSLKCSESEDHDSKLNIISETDFRQIKPDKRSFRVFKIGVLSNPEILNTYYQRFPTSLSEDLRFLYAVHNILMEVSAKINYTTDKFNEVINDRVQFVFKRFWLSNFDYTNFGNVGYTGSYDTSQKSLDDFEQFIMHPNNLINKEDADIFCILTTTDFKINGSLNGRANGFANVCGDDQIIPIFSSVSSISIPVNLNGLSDCIFAHEIGHLFGGQHTNEVSIMSPGLPMLWPITRNYVGFELEKEIFNKEISSCH